MICDEQPKWIWSSDYSAEDKERPTLYYFRHEFELDDQPLEARISISADTRYKLFVNGNFVEVGPSKGDLQLWFLDTIEISRYLNRGKNVIGVVVLRFPLDPRKGTSGMFRTPYPGLYVDLHLTNNQGDLTRITSDATWRVHKVPDFNIIDQDMFGSLQLYEERSGNQELQGWKTSGYDNTGWLTAVAYPAHMINGQDSPGNLHERTIPFMFRRHCRFDRVVTVREGQQNTPNWSKLILSDEPITIRPHRREIVELSAGEEMTAYIQLRMMAGKGTTIQILQAESYLQDGETSTNGFAIPIKGDREDYRSGHLDGPVDIYHVSGFGCKDSEEVISPFFFRTFRFIRLSIETAEEPLVLTKFDYEETGYPLMIQSGGETSDESLQKIWDISARTLQRCMHETYEDCPFYEQLQYVMDSRLQMLYTYAVAYDDRLARKCLDDMRRSQRYDGLLNSCYPSVESNVIPTFSLYYILMLDDHRQYFDDTRLLEMHLPTVQRILHFFEQHVTDKGIVGKIGGIRTENRDQYWSFVDWTPEWNETNGIPVATESGPLTIESLAYVMGLQAAARIANAINQTELAKNYTQKAVVLQQSIRLQCTGRNGMLQDGPGVETYSQHVQVYAVLTDTVSQSCGRENLLRTIDHKDEYAQCSVAMAFYLFRALEKTGLYSRTDEYWNIWRRMVAKNATTCFEAEDGDRSDCHAWGALILYELPTVILGVRPSKPGFREVLIKPEPGYLHWAKGTVITPSGLIAIEWKQTDQLEVIVNVPENIVINIDSSVDKVSVTRTKKRTNDVIAQAE